MVLLLIHVSWTYGGSEKKSLPYLATQGWWEGVLQICIPPSMWSGTHQLILLMSSSNQAGAIISYQFIALIELCEKHCRCLWERRKVGSTVFALREVVNRKERAKQTCHWQQMNKSRCAGGKTRSSFSMKVMWEDSLVLSFGLILWVMVAIFTEQ